MQRKKTNRIQDELKTNKQTLLSTYEIDPRMRRR
jgi:hypothetical protein